jgi:flagellin-like hook-associated protein FlgL
MKFLIFCAVLMLSACSSLLEVKTIETPINISHPNDPRPIATSDVRWIVLNEEEMKKILEDPNSDVVLFAVSPGDFENMVTNISELIRYIDQQKAIIGYYRSTIDKVNEEIKKPLP